MCGITGVSGRYAANKALGMTLAQLSRGTQGAGAAFIDPNDHSLQVWKKAEHPVKFAVENHYFWGIHTYSAICHNRMPSRGKIAMENTHPFMDCHGRFALIHNGTVGGVDPERTRLREAGHRIEGDTDSEVLAHLICEQLDNGLSMLDALRKLNETFPATILVLMADGDIYGMKSSYPMWVCTCEGDQHYEPMVAIASEKHAIETGMPELERRQHTFVEIKEGDILHVQKGKLELLEHHPKAVSAYQPQPWQRPAFDKPKLKNTDSGIWAYDKHGKRVELKYPPRNKQPYPDRFGNGDYSF